VSHSVVAEVSVTQRNRVRSSTPARRSLLTSVTSSSGLAQSLSPTLLVSLALLTFLVASNPVHAFSVQPLQMQLEPFGDASRGTFEVANDGIDSVSIEALPMRVDHDEEGREVLTDAEDDLLVFPPVAIVPPGSVQSIQVQFIGNPAIVASGTFRVLIENVPVELEGGAASGIALKRSIQTLLHVVPSGTRSEPSVIGTEVAQNGVWHVTIANEGKRYARLPETQWVLESDSVGTLVLNGEQVDERTNANLVLPGASRRFDFVAPQGYTAQDTSITILPIE